ncbi:tyrosine-type recombinase/integrase [Chloroflexota bacterium]
MVRYAGIMRGFMDWYGETLDLRPLKPKSLPEYVDPNDVEKLIDFIQNKGTHKGTIKRDVILVKFVINTGLRRGELANLLVSDIQIEQGVVFVRHGKGDKDRAIPLLSKFVGELSEYIKDMKPTDSIFGLTKRSITDKISTWSKKAGLKIHTHSLRHYFAEQLIERGVPLTVVSTLLGHEDLQTTSSYLGLRPGSLREAVEKLGEPRDKEENKTSKPQNKIDQGRSSLESLAVDGEEHGLPKEPQTGQAPYTETPHKQKMRELAGDLQLEVGLPHVLDIFLKPRLNTVALSIDQEENYLYQGLRSHLESGGFSEVMEKIQDWENGAREYLSKCSDLLESVKGRIPKDEVIVSSSGELKPGLVLDSFCGTVGADVVARITGSPTQLGYKAERHYLQPDLLILKYGAYEIYLGLKTEDLEKYRKIHMDVILEYASDQSTSDMATLKKKLSEIENQISQQLQKFIEMERVLGHCELCRTSPAL